MGVARLARLVVMLFAGCGRIGFDVRDQDGGDQDGGLPLDDGRITGPFGAPSKVDELSSVDVEGDPALTGDMLELYFDSDRPGGAGGSDIWRATRVNPADVWSPPTPVVELSSSAFDGAVGITADGSLMFLTSNRAGGAGSFDLWMSTRANRTSPWSAPVFVPELSSSADDSNPQPTTDGLEIWFSSSRAATARQLYRATRANLTAMWSTPVEVTEVNVGTTITTADPWIDATGIELYFASNRSGGIGNNDLWHIQRASPTQAFESPTPIVELNAVAGDRDPWVSPDGRTIVFTSRRSGNEDIYTATR